MRTTVRISDELLKRAKKRAADQGRTLTSLIEEGLSLILTDSRSVRRDRVQLPVSTATGGVQPGIDLNRSCELEEVMSQP